jgi:MFS family permease
VIAAASVVIGAGFTLLALAHTALLLAAAVTAWSLGEIAQWPVAAAYTTSLAPPGMTGRYAGARSFCNGLALLLAPLAGTALYHLNPAVLWAACGAAGICAAAIITFPRDPAARAAHAERASALTAAANRGPSDRAAPHPASGANPSRGLVPHPSGKPIGR